ncbi:unnamed protein product [Heligmosomoides polygyrus]|uniref:Calpain catalytic domain-containing protein n=1 Tax=Heligmosomoides polygyrus TaxID=6339 RepID=A0A183GDS1_HELPZ|nr:unnamed protein product [Heligmosomoides polygyrus]
MVEKFTISEEQYNQREGECQQHGFNRVDSTFPLGQDPERFVLDSVRAWKKKLLAQNAGGQESTAAAGDEAKESAAEDIKVHIPDTFLAVPISLVV